MSPNVLISDALSPSAVQIFKDRGIEVDFQPKLGADKERLAQLIGDFDGLAIRSATKVTPKVLEKAKRLKRLRSVSAVRSTNLQHGGNENLRRSV